MKENGESRIDSGRTTKRQKTHKEEDVIAIAGAIATVDTGDASQLQQQQSQQAKKDGSKNDSCLQQVGADDEDVDERRFHHRDDDEVAAAAVTHRNEEVLNPSASDVVASGVVLRRKYLTAREQWLALSCRCSCEQEDVVEENEEDGVAVVAAKQDQQHRNQRAGEEAKQQRQQVLQVYRDLWRKYDSSSTQTSSTCCRRCCADVGNGGKQQDDVIRGDDDDDDENGRQCCGCEQQEIYVTAGERLALLLLQQEQQHHQQPAASRGVGGCGSAVATTTTTTTTTTAISSSSRKKGKNGGSSDDGDDDSRTIFTKLGYTCRLALHVLNYDDDDENDARSDNEQQQKQREGSRDGVVTSSNNDVAATATAVGKSVVGNKKNNFASRAAVVLDPPCRILDNVLSKEEIERLDDIFLNPRASYWIDHNYAVEPPSPYFSYLIPLFDKSKILDDGGDSNGVDAKIRGDDALIDEFGGLGVIVRKLQKQIGQWKPLVKRATFCEMWAHNRPPATGHQLHYDTDNEGCDGIVRHPLVTAILYLTDHGGPTVVTNQRLAASNNRPADRGWMAHPKRNRVVLMDGRVLHCVVPGKLLPSAKVSFNNVGGYCHHGEERRRVTLMLAFWKHIRVRGEEKNDGLEGEAVLPTFGAARRFPAAANASSARTTCPTNNGSSSLAPTPPPPQWAAALRAPLSSAAGTERNDDVCNGVCRQVEPVPIGHVYESVEESKPWTRQMGMPVYDQVFQGV